MDLLSLQINKEERNWSEIDSVAVIISENIGSILTFRMKGYLVILWRSKQSNKGFLNTPETSGQSFGNKLTWAIRPWKLCAVR